MKKLFAALLVVLLVAYLQPVDVYAEDHRILPIRTDLLVNLVFVDVDLSLFGVTRLDDLVNAVASNVRRQAKSYITWDGPFAPYEFDVKLRGFQSRGAMIQEFRAAWRSLNQPVPRDLLEYIGVKGPLSSIHAPTAFKTLIDLSNKHIQPNLDGYTIFFICGETALRSKPSYYTYAIVPDTGKAIGDLFLNMYGGPWWGRAVFIDLCAETRYEEYPPVTALRSPAERIALLSKYVDELVDLQFVKSMAYLPYYNLQIFVDVIVVDASGQGLNFQRLVSAFDVEMAEKALKTLTPYNFYYFTIRLYDVNEIPGFSQIIKVTELEHPRRGKVQAAVFDALEADAVLRKAGIIGAKQENYKYIPALIVVSNYETVVYYRVEDYEAYVGGVALWDHDDPRYPGTAVAGASYGFLFYYGMTHLVIHEVGHSLGLRHPHDDFDESKNQEIWEKWIYTDSIETQMTYSDNLAEAFKRRTMREGHYPIRTFWSIFDLDAIDRATISLLLQGYEENYEQILKRLNEAGRKAEEIPTLSNALRTAVNWAKQAVTEFKKMNYFDRLEFKGLGAQTTTSLEYAFMAWAVTDLLKLYVEGLVTTNQKLSPLLDELEKEINSLTQELRSLENEVKSNEERLTQIQARINTAQRTKDELRNRINELSKEAEQLPELKKKEQELENRYTDVKNKVDSLQNESSQLRLFNTLLMGVAAAMVAVSAASVFLIRRRAF